MSNTLRIPAADLSGPIMRVLARLAVRMWGQLPDGAYVMGHHPRLARSVLAFERRVAGWDRLDPHLKTYAVMASAGTIGCSWCLDFGYFMASQDGLDLAKVREVPRWRESATFTDLERDVLAYAEAMTLTPPAVTDAMVAGLDSALGHAALVELTMIVAVENERSRFNAAMGLSSQGFSDACDLPLDVASSS